MTPSATVTTMTLSPGGPALLRWHLAVPLLAAVALTVDFSPAAAQEANTDRAPRITLRASYISASTGGDLEPPYPEGSGWGVEATLAFADWLAIGAGISRVSATCTEECAGGGTGGIDTLYPVVRLQWPVVPRVRPWMALGFHFTTIAHDVRDQLDRHFEWEERSRDGLQFEVGVDVVAIDWLGIAPFVRYHGSDLLIPGLTAYPFPQREVDYSVVELGIGLVLSPSLRVR